MEEAVARENFQKQVNEQLIKALLLTESHRSTPKSIEILTEKFCQDFEKISQLFNNRQKLYDDDLLNLNKQITRQQ